MRATRESSYPAALPWLAAAVPWVCIGARGVPGGDDWQLEVARVAAYAYAWSDAQWPPYWAPDLYGGYGSPIFLFYGHTCLAIASLFVLVTRNFTFALMLALASAGLLGVFSVRRAGASALPGVEGAAAGRVAAYTLLLNPYLLGDLLLRNAAAEYTALCAMPLALAGLWLLRHDDRRGVLYIAAGTGLVIATHALSALVACALLLGLAPSALLTAAGGVSARRRWLGLALGLGLGIALTGYAWLPALSLNGLIRTEDLLAGKFHYRDQMPALRTLFDGSTFYSAGPLPLLAVVAAALSLGTTRRERGIAGQAAGASSATSAKNDPSRVTVISLLIAVGALVFVQTQMSVPLWEHLPGMRYFQFPWRFMGPLAIVTALLAGLAFVRLTRGVQPARRFQLELVIWVVCVMGALPQLSRARGLQAFEVARLESMLERNNLRRLRFTATARDEYLPRGSLPSAIQRPSADEPIPAASDGLRVAIRQDEPRRMVLDVRALSDSRLCLARWGFPFWEVRVDDQLQPPDTCAGGCLGVRVASGRHHIVASLPVPQPRIVGLVLSGLGLLGTLLLARRGKRAACQATQTRAAPTRARIVRAPARERADMFWRVRSRGPRVASRALQSAMAAGTSLAWLARMHDRDQMLHRFYLWVLLSTVIQACAADGAATSDVENSPVASNAAALRRSPERPNILLIIADDLGYSDIGAFGGEIHTPNLDDLAKQGRLLTDHHTAPTCSPTRSMLFSGTDHHLVGLGTMAELLQPEQTGKPGYEGYLNDHALSFADLLHDSGYHTYIAGKWHLGLTEERSPKAWGFESSFVLTQGAASHFAPDATRLTNADNSTYRENGAATSVPADFFSTNYYTDKLLQYLEANRGDGKPFLALATYTAPHWPLQAPEDFIDRYRGRYDAGYEAIRTRRIARQKQLGVIPWDFKPHQPLVSTDTNPSWESLTPEQRKFEARRMEIYAAMVENLDFNIGRLFRYLKRTGQYDNTFIFFQSDNGAEGGSGFQDNASNDNSYENLGRRYSNVAYGKRWGEVSAAPFRPWKAYTSEGGVSVPAIAHLPKQAFPRLHFSGFTHVSDLAPTFLELAGVADPGTAYKGRTVYPITGKSIVARLENRAFGVHAWDEVFAEELFGRRYVRRGHWKLLYIEPPFGSGAWALYDLASDAAESTDVAAQHPQIVAELEAEWAAYAARVGLIVPNNNPGPNY